MRSLKVTPMKARACELAVVLEIAATKNALRDSSRLQRAYRLLQRGVINGVKVSGVMLNLQEKPVEVPDFGHDYRCRCSSPKPERVLRYFGLSLIVDGNPNCKWSGEYWIEKGVSMLLVCGECMPLEGNVWLEKVGVTR